MKHKYLEEIAIPEGVSCTLQNGVLSVAKGGKKVERKALIPRVTVSLSNDKITFSAKQGNKRVLATMRSWIAHLKNIFLGLDSEFVYTMEVCNVHFPMTVKVEGKTLVVNNFLGEKEKRIAKILPDVEVKINGPKLEIKSFNLEAAGQTAANIEKATWVKHRDRRVFQDGIFITSKPGDEE